MAIEKMIPPEPRPPFVWSEQNGRLALVCAPLQLIAPHFYTTRSWRLDWADDGEAWREVGEAIDTPPERVVRARQVHGADLLVQPAGGAPVPTAAADIIATTDATFALAIRTADCVPLLIADRRTGAVLAAHAGWRGTAQRVAVKAVEALRERFGSAPIDLIAAIGPTIGPCCYEVGEEVRDRFVGERFTEQDLSCWFSSRATRLGANPPMPRTHGNTPSGLYLDLWRATRDQLESSGIPGDQIFAAELCTASHRDTFCSYRRDGKNAGRLVSVIRARS